MKTIMLINDDGVHSSGLLALKHKLDKLGKVVVVTPKEEKSGIGKAITSAEHVRIEETRLSDGSKAYATSGTPADSFLLGMYKILKQPLDLVVSGINLGPNLGIDDFLNSGTLGAAIEAAIHNVPAVAVSYCKKQIIDREADKKSISLQELELTASVAAKVVKLVLEKGMPEGVDILSVNVPEEADSRKVKVTTLSYVGYRDIYSKETEGYRIAHWRLADYSDDDLGTDVHAVKEENCIAITPVKIKLQHNTKALESLLRKFWTNDG
jgi:5'-nucleotidase